MCIRDSAYAFDRYKTKSKDKDEAEPLTVSLRAADPSAVKKAV